MCAVAPLLTAQSHSSSHPLRALNVGDRAALSKQPQWRYCTGAPRSDDLPSITPNQKSCYSRPQPIATCPTHRSWPFHRKQPQCSSPLLWLWQAFVSCCKLQALLSSKSGNDHSQAQYESLQHTAPDTLQPALSPHLQTMTRHASVLRSPCSRSSSACDCPYLVTLEVGHWSD